MNAPNPVGGSHLRLVKPPDAVEIIDADGARVRVTPGRYDYAASRLYKNGQCLALAQALHERTGWPIAAIFDDDHLVRHVYVQDPTGLLLDIDGSRTVSQELLNWQNSDIEDFEHTLEELEGMDLSIPMPTAPTVYPTSSAAWDALGGRVTHQDVETARPFASDLLAWWAEQDGPAYRVPPSEADAGRSRADWARISSSADQVAAFAEFVANAEVSATQRVVEQMNTQQLRAMCLGLAQSVAAGQVDAGEVPDMSPNMICAMAVDGAATAFGTTPAAVLSADRHRTVTDARAVAMTAARRTGMTLPAIASHFGKNHATVIYSLHKVEGSPRLEKVCQQITTQIDHHYQPTQTASRAADGPASSGAETDRQGTTRRSSVVQLGALTSAEPRPERAEVREPSQAPSHGPNR